MSEEFIGRSIDFAVATEVVRGTAETTADRTVRKVECNIIPRAERITDDSTFGRLEDAERVRTVRKWSEGDVSGLVHADVLGYFLLNLYGDVTSTPSGTTATHEFTLQQDLLHPTLTLFVKDGEVRQSKIAGGVISTMEVTASTDDFVRYSASFLGKEGADDTSNLPALATEYDFVSRDITVKIADTEAGLSSATALKLKNLSINWNSNAEADWVFGSYSPDNIYNKTFAIEGSFERNFTDETFKDLYEGDTFKYMEVEIEGEADLGSGVKPTVTVLFYKIQITDWSRTSTGDDLVMETVNFKAFLNTTDSAQSKVTLINKTAEYESAS
jgi:hypothetical protein